MMVKKTVIGLVGMLLAATALGGWAASGPDGGPGTLWDHGTIGHVDEKNGILIIDDAPHRISQDVVVMRGRAKSVGIGRLRAGMAIEYRLGVDAVSGSPLIYEIRTR